MMPLWAQSAGDQLGVSSGAAARLQDPGIRREIKAVDQRVPDPDLVGAKHPESEGQILVVALGLMLVIGQIARIATRQLGRID